MGLPEPPLEPILPPRTDTNANEELIAAHPGDNSLEIQPSSDTASEIEVPSWGYRSLPSVVGHLDTPLKRSKAYFVYMSYLQRWHRMDELYRRQLEELHNKRASIQELRLLIHVMTSKMDSLEDLLNLELSKALENLTPVPGYSNFVFVWLQENLRAPTEAELSRLAFQFNVTPYELARVVEGLIRRVNTAPTVLN